MTHTESLVSENSNAFILVDSIIKLSSTALFSVNGHNIFHVIYSSNSGCPEHFDGKLASCSILRKYLVFTKSVMAQITGVFFFIINYMLKHFNRTVLPSLSFKFEAILLDLTSKYSTDHKTSFKFEFVQ